MQISDIDNLTIETCTICNSRCMICPNYNKKFRRPPYMMPLGLFRQIVSSFPNLKDISLCGMYEPLADNRLKEIFDIIRDINPKIDIAIFSNGSLLDKWESLLLDNSYNLISIVFSVHGYSPGTYNTIMTGLDRNTTYKNIINFCEKRNEKSNDSIVDSNDSIVDSKDRKIRKPKISVSLIRTSLNMYELRTFIKFWTPIVDHVSNFELMNWNGSVTNYEELLDKKKNTTRACPMFEYPMVIDAYGDVVRCCYNLRYNYGRAIKDDGTVDTGMIEYLAKKRFTNTYPNSDCKNCDGWKFY